MHPSPSHSTAREWLGMLANSLPCITGGEVGPGVAGRPAARRGPCQEAVTETAWDTCVKIWPHPFLFLFKRLHVGVSLSVKGTCREKEGVEWQRLEGGEKLLQLTSTSRLPLSLSLSAHSTLRQITCPATYGNVVCSHLIAQMTSNSPNFIELVLCRRVVCSPSSLELQRTYSVELSYPSH